MGANSPSEKRKMTLTKTKTLQPIPYLFFNGNCREAINFYKDVLGGKLLSVTTYGDMPMAESMTPQEPGNIVNAQLELPGGPILMAGDAHSMFSYTGIQGVS